MNFRILALCLICISPFYGIAQDEHFSQFYALPVHMNPALTGAYDGTYRLTLVYRDQWGSALASPYSTFAVGGDTRINMKYKKRSSDDFIGVGLYFVGDRFNEYQSATNKLQTSASFHKRIGDKNASYLSAGVQLGIIQRNINYDNLFFEDQFDQINTYNLPTGEVLPPNNFGVIDLSFGVTYSVQLEKSAFYLGVGGHHLNEPAFSYFGKLELPNPNIDISQKINTKWVAHLSVDKQLSYATKIQPRLIYQIQEKNTQIDFGSNFEYTFKSRNNALILGLWLTAVSDIDNFHLEALTPLIGIRQKQFIFGFSYDIHLEDAFDPTYGFNAFEFSIRFSGAVSDNGAFCPTF